MWTILVRNIWGDMFGIFGTKGDHKYQNYPPKCSVRKLFTLLGNVSISGESFFRFWVSKQMFNLCSHIELNTQNPNLIFKITICFTKTPTMFKYFRNFGEKSQNYNKHIVLYINFMIHILQLWYFCKFWNFWVLYIFLDNRRAAIYYI